MDNAICPNSQYYQSSERQEPKSQSQLIPELIPKRQKITNAAKVGEEETHAYC